MTDYISRDAALKAANAFWYAPDVPKAIEEIPAADVVEVTRCRDCRYYTSVTAHCEVRGTGRFLIRGENDFCSRAERREDE